MLTGSERKRQGGLTLLETGIAAFIFAIAAMSLGALFSNAQSSTTRATQRLVANTLATRYIEEAVEAGKFGAVPSPGAGTFDVRTVRRGNDYQVEYRWTRTVTGLPSGVYDVVVTVEWDYASTNYSVTREVLVHPPT